MCARCETEKKCDGETLRIFLLFWLNPPTRPSKPPQVFTVNAVYMQSSMGPYYGPKFFELKKATNYSKIYG